MATESRVTTEHSHPFSTGLDLCLVHNGSLSNHNRLRRHLRRAGDRVPDRQRHRGRGRVPDLAPLRRATTSSRRCAAASRTSTASTPSRSARPTGSPSCATRSPASRRCSPRPTTGSRWPPSTARSRRCPAPTRRSSGSPSPAACTPGSGRRSRERADAAVESVDLATTIGAGAEPAPARPRARRPRAGGSTNPNGAHSIAVGLDAEVEVEIDGHVGYYCAGMNKLATRAGRGATAGPAWRRTSCRGSVVVDGDASQSAGATGRGGTARHQGQRLGPLRDLDEGRRDRRPRLGRPRRGRSWPSAGRWSSAVTPARASATRSTRPAIYVRGEVAEPRAPTASRRRCGDEHRAELGELLEARPRPTFDPGRVPALRLGPPALQLRRRQRGRVLGER